MQIQVEIGKMLLEVKLPGEQHLRQPEAVYPDVVQVQIELLRRRLLLKVIKFFLKDRLVLGAGKRNVALEI